MLGARECKPRTAGANGVNPPSGFVHDSVTDDTLAQALLHEIAHTLSLRHNPTDWACAPDPIGRYEEGIEGFRLDLSGLNGWNKSVSEGNGEVGEGILRHDLLLSLMWPYPLPIAGVMLTMDEYAAVQQDIERGFSLSSRRQEGPGCPD
ncbi:hypothetical protein [Aquibaculum sediminis]|uniref:hypothetical protein n=1 Tax=Aquibaculum sediminis TaxID=3231907 RepID=UPI003451DF14